MYSNIDKKEVYFYPSFLKTFTILLHKYAPLRKKIVRYDNNPHIAKALRKAIMLRSKIKNQLKTGITTKDKETFV